MSFIFGSAVPSGDVGGDWDLEDEDLKLELEKPGEASVSTSEAYFVPPTQGTSITELWQRNSKLPVDHILAGSFDSAMRILNQELGIVRFAPLKDYFLRLSSSSRSSLPCTPSVRYLFGSFFSSSSSSFHFHPNLLSFFFPTAAFAARPHSNQIRLFKLWEPHRSLDCLPAGQGASNSLPDCDVRHIRGGTGDLQKHPLHEHFCGCRLQG